MHMCASHIYNTGIPTIVISVIIAIVIWVILGILGVPKFWISCSLWVYVGREDRRPGRGRKWGWPVTHDWCQI